MKWKLVCNYYYYFLQVSPGVVVEGEEFFVKYKN